MFGVVQEEARRMGDEIMNQELSKAQEVRSDETLRVHFPFGFPQKVAQPGCLNSSEE